MSGVMVGLAFLLLSLPQVSVHGARVNTGSSQKHASVVDKFALSESHIKNLCTDEAVKDACAALGASPEPSAQASIEQLAEILVTHEAEAVSFVEELGLSLDGTSFKCRSFCEAVVKRIPNVLHVAAPQTRNVGCIDDACDKDVVDLSRGALLKGGLSSPPPPPHHADNNRSLLRENVLQTSDMEPEARRQVLFRTTLNIILGIFPTPDEADEGPTDEADEGSGASLLERPGSAGGSRVAFGPYVRTYRHDDYKRYLLRASAWIASAIRNLAGGRSSVRKWFILNTEKEVDLQTNVARRHLTKMLQLTNHIMIKKGKDSDCEVTKTPSGGEYGTLAFVMAYPDCSVYSSYDCGQKAYDGRYIVNICEFYWRASWGESTRIGTLVHESSHHFGTDDKGYCDAINCLDLSSAEAKNNADTYTQLVKELVRNNPGNDAAVDNIEWTTTYGGDKNHGTYNKLFLKAVVVLGFAASCCCICGACALCCCWRSTSSSEQHFLGNQPGFDVLIPEDVAPGKDFRFIHPSTQQLMQVQAPLDGSRTLRINA